MTADNYGEVLDGREGEFVHRHPGKLRAGDVQVSFDGWFARGHKIAKVVKVTAGRGRTSYRITVESSKGGGPRTFTVGAQDRIEVLG